MKSGAQLTPTLELVREIGRGAMGSVWEARNKALGTSVAVKLLRPDTLFTEDGEARFEREIEVLASLDHPHLVHIVDRGKTSDGAPYFVMEYLRGEDLGARLARDGVLTVDDTVTIVAQTCRGLAVAHARGIIHRDLKPANIFLLDDDGRPFVKVLDFGIAKRASELGMTSTGLSVGTPYFMSPEQFFTPSKADQRTDLWALGVLAYVCLAGALPFVGETPSAIGLAAMQHRFTPITELRPALGPDWDAFFARALHSDPARRFASAQELVEALRSVQAGTASASLSGLTGAGGRRVSDEASEALALAPTDVVATRPEPEEASTAVTPADARPRHAFLRPWALAATVLVGTLGVVAILAPREPAPDAGSIATETPSAQLPTASAAPVPSGLAPLVSAHSEASALAPSASAQSSAAPRVPSSALVGPTSPIASRSFPINVVLSCWRDTEGATSAQNAHAQVEVELTAAGKALSVRVSVPHNQFPGFRGCVVTRLSEISYGPGARERLMTSVGLPRSFAK